MMVLASLAEKMAKKYPDNIEIVREEAGASSPRFLEREVTKPVEDFVAKGVPDGSLPEPVREGLEWDGRCHGVTKLGDRCRIKVPAGVFFCRKHEGR